MLACCRYCADLDCVEIQLSSRGATTGNTGGSPAPHANAVGWAPNLDDQHAHLGRLLVQMGVVNLADPSTAVIASTLTPDKQEFVSGAGELVLQSAVMRTSRMSLARVCLQAVSVKAEYVCHCGQKQAKNHEVSSPPFPMPSNPPCYICVLHLKTNSWAYQIGSKQGHAAGTGGLSLTTCL